MPPYNLKFVINTTNLAAADDVKIARGVNVLGQPLTKRKK
jgi:hypothetical protein